MAKTIKATFARGARRVTGSNFLFEIEDNPSATLGAGGKTTRILIDCGLSQGERFCELTNSQPFSYDPKTVDAIFFTHAHADHIGLFPRLVKEGFVGKAYATVATKELMPIMLEDSVQLIALEAKRCNNEPPYDGEDVARAVEHITALDYHSPVSVAPGITVTLYNAGHILGSALVVLDIDGRRIVMTGDLGRVPSALVPDHEVPEGTEILVTESVYGNRTHGSIEDSKEALLEAVRGAVAKKGTLLIPAFSLERTQIILSIIDAAMSAGTLPSIPVFMDSPLAAKVTAVYKRHPEFLREEIRKRLEGGDDPFAFPSLKVTLRPDESPAISKVPGPKVIIAGAGMSHGGRIKKHEAEYLPHKETTILLVGYQVPGSLGRRIMDGAKEVDIDGQKIKIRAKVLKVGGFSAHADRDDLMDFAEKIAPKRAFVVLGETEGATFLAQRISGFFDIPVDVPREGEVYEL
ncbi:MBL fold metallo-hydrolase [Patescibacteria group bacterium]|nr:MBL fold metallo-hydrolase [Patescibacteria group bacterium]